MTIGITININEEFSVIRETLERIGVKNSKKKKFIPSCYIVGTSIPTVYKLVHFKELFPLIGRETDFNKDDELKRNTIAVLLANWGLITYTDTDLEYLPEKIPVLSHKEKSKYEIIHKFKFPKKIVIDL